MYDLDMHLGFI